MTTKHKDSVELLEVTIDDRPTFEKHLNKLCRSANYPLNAHFDCFDRKL